MTIPDLPDFVTAVNFRDIANEVAGFPQTIAKGATAQVPGVDQAESLTLMITPPAGAVGDEIALILDWNSGTAEADQDVLTFHSVNSYASRATQLYFQTPCRGAALSITYENSGAGGLLVDASLSNRSVQGPRLTRQGNNQGRLLLDTGLISIPAGGVGATWYIPPVAATCLIRVGNVNATAPGHVTISGVGLPGGAPTSEGVDVPSGTGNFAVRSFPLPMTGMEMQLGNDDTVARNMRLSVWDNS